MTIYARNSEVTRLILPKAIIVLTFITIFSPVVSNASQNKSIASVTINFVGAIVESPCQSVFDNETVEISCWNKGKEIKTTSTIASFKNGSLYLPEYKAKISFEWIKYKKNLGLYKIAYY